MWKADKCCGTSQIPGHMLGNQRSIGTQTIEFASVSRAEMKCSDCGQTNDHGGDEMKTGKVTFLAGKDLQVCPAGHFKPLAVRVCMAGDRNTYCLGVLNHSAQKSIHGKSIPCDGVDASQEGYEDLFAHECKVIERGFTWFEEQEAHILRVKKNNQLGRLEILKVLVDGEDMDELLEHL